MNYLKEINAFYTRVDLNSLSASAVSLWHALMQINNKARWKKTFTASALALRTFSRLTESSFKRARNELKEKGYIDFKSRTSNQAPIYQMNSLVENWESTYALENEKEPETNHIENWNIEYDCDQNETSITSHNSQFNQDHDIDYITDHNLNHSLDNTMNCTTDHADAYEHYLDDSVYHNMNRNMDHKTGHSMNCTPDPLYKHKQNEIETKQNKINTYAADIDEHKSSDHSNNYAYAHMEQGNEKPTTENSHAVESIEFYQKNFGPTSPFIAQSLIHWVNDLGEALVIEAMKRALERSKLSWGYVKSILQAWANKGIHTLEQVQAEDIVFKNNQQEKLHVNSGRGEIVPEWFEEHKRKTAEKRLEQKNRMKNWEQVDLEAQKQELQKLLHGHKLMEC